MFETEAWWDTALAAAVAFRAGRRGIILPQSPPAWAVAARLGGAAGAGDPSGDGEAERGPGTLCRMRVEYTRRSVWIYCL
jgi:hypothetical protein